MIDPEKYIIVRKRKKYRFALFAEADNCFELDQWIEARSQVLGQQPLTIEVGAGTALFLVELAKRYPDQHFLAIDVKADRLQKGAHLALELGLDNIWFVRARADQLLEVVEDSSVSTIWLTFSDPFPRQRDAKRRLTSPRFLELYASALKSDGVLRQKTDNHDLFDWSLEQLVKHGWRVRELSYDLHSAKLPDDYKILTTYEERWLNQGLKTHYLSASLDGQLRPNPTIDTTGTH